MNVKLAGYTDLRGSSHYMLHFCPLMRMADRFDLPAQLRSLKRWVGPTYLTQAIQNRTRLELTPKS